MFSYSCVLLQNSPPLLVFIPRGYTWKCKRWIAYSLHVIKIYVLYYNINFYCMRWICQSCTCSSVWWTVALVGIRDKSVKGCKCWATFLRFEWLLRKFIIWLFIFCSVLTKFRSDKNWINCAVRVIYLLCYLKHVRISWTHLYYLSSYSY